MSTQIDELPVEPSPTDPVDTFDAKAFAFNAALQTFRSQANALGQEMQINADVAAALILAMALPQFAGTSITSVTVGTGARTFETQAGKGWLPGQIVVASSGANYVKGTVTAYSGTDLQLNVTSINGSGTYAAWNIGLSYDGLALVSKGPVTTSGLTQATARLLGRTTAGTGAVEELTVGAGLTLAGGVLSNSQKPPALGAAAATGVASIDFTSIPAWVNNFDIPLAGYSTSGPDHLLFQLGSGGIKTSGYFSTAMNLAPGPSLAAGTFTAGFGVLLGASSAVIHGKVSFSRASAGSNTWVFTQNISRSDGVVCNFGGGSVTLTGALDTIRITTVGGVNTIDSGSIAAPYWSA